MTGLDALRLRTRRLTDHHVQAGDYVLCWLMQALRADENPALDAAIALSNKEGLPVVVLHALENTYPHASHRLHRFILEASRELGPGVEARGLRFVRYVRQEGEGEVDLVARLAERAAAVVVDDVPTFVTRGYADALAARLGRAVLAVDACCAVPMNAFTKHLGSTPAFRAAHTPLRKAHVQAEMCQEPDAERFDGDLGLESLDLPGQRSRPRRPHRRVAASTPACRRRRAGLAPARPRSSASRSPSARWCRATSGPATTPRWTTGRPPSRRGCTSASSRPARSPGPCTPPRRRATSTTAARWKFLDEALTWREYYHHRARHVPNWACWAGLPSSARETLLAHADDPRPTVYSLGELARGETDDETWNAAQKQFLLDGWMHNNLRMVWVKQILKWTPSPQSAWATACYLNDRFSLDGRDASTYGGIRWGFGDAKPGYREVPIYGTVATKGDGAVRKRDGAAEWLAEQAARAPLDVAIPDNPAEAFARYL